MCKRARSQVQSLVGTAGSLGQLGLSHLCHLRVLPLQMASLHCHSSTVAWWFRALQRAKAEATRLSYGSGPEQVQCHFPTFYCLKQVTDHPRFIMGEDFTRWESREVRFIGDHLWRMAVRVLYLGVHKNMREWTIDCTSICLFNRTLRQNKVSDTNVREWDSGINSNTFGIGECINQTV